MSCLLPEGVLIPSMKPALPREIAFYQLLSSAKTGPLAAFRPYVPKFFGTLRLEGQLQGDAIVKAKDDGIELAIPEVGYSSTKEADISPSCSRTCHSCTHVPVSWTSNSGRNCMLLRLRMRRRLGWRRRPRRPPAMKLV